MRSEHANPRDGWTSETARQHRIARNICGDMARRYVAEGITCVIDDATFPLRDEGDDASWRSALGDTPTYEIALLPSYETVAAHDASRSGRCL